SYDIQVDEISAFGNPLIASASVTASQWTTGTLPAGTWFWRVRAVNSEGTPGAWSATRTITIPDTPPPAPPAVPSLLSPASDARFSPGAVTFDWTDVSGASGYTIQIDDSSGFSAPLTLEQTVSSSQLTTSALPAKRLWWRVRANDGGA